MTPNHDDPTRDDATRADDRPPTHGQGDDEARRGVGEVPPTDLRDADAPAREAAGDRRAEFRGPAPLHEPAPLRGPAPLRVAGHASPESTFATGEPILTDESAATDGPTTPDGPTTRDGPTATDDPAAAAVPADADADADAGNLSPSHANPKTAAWLAAAPPVFRDDVERSDDSGPASASPVEAVASHLAGPADEPAVDEVAPLAVAGGDAPTASSAAAVPAGESPVAAAWAAPFATSGERRVTHVEPVPIPDGPEMTRVEPGVVRPGSGATPIVAVTADAGAPAVVPVVEASAAPAVVVKTRTGPVALDRQPPVTAAPRPAPVPIVEPTPTPVAVVKPARLASLDIFRGITIAMMVLVNNEGIGHAYAPLDHAEWHGWTPTDLVFPFFLFIVGVATPFSLGKRAAVGGQSRGALLGHIWIRALSLMLLGWLLSAFYSPLPWRDLPPGGGFWFTTIFRGLAFPFATAAIVALLVPWRSRPVATIVPLATLVLLVGYAVAMHFVRLKAIANGWDPKTFGGGLCNPDQFRIPGVLVRIGVCYGVAASIALLGGRWLVWPAILVLFAVYSWLMLGVRGPGQDEVGSLTPEDNFAHHVDVAVFERSHVDPETGKTLVTQKHTWRDYADNEGLVSTLPAIGTALIGVLVGFGLRRAELTPAEKCAGLLARGVGVTCAGVALSWWLMPINKNLWTPSFSVFTAGLAMLGLGATFWLADVRGRRWFLWPFKVFGMNAIAAFAASSIVVRLSSAFPFHAFDRAKGKVVETTGVGWVKQQARDGVVQASDWLGAHHVDWLGHALNTPQNTSLAGALAFLVVVFVLMLFLYVCRIFVKV